MRMICEMIYLSIGELTQHVLNAMCDNIGHSMEMCTYTFSEWKMTIAVYELMCTAVCLILERIVGLMEINWPVLLSNAI